MKIHSVIVWAFLILFLVVLNGRCFAQATEAGRKVGETLETAIPQEQQTEGETPPKTKGEIKVEAVKKIAEEGRETAEKEEGITGQSRFKELRVFGHNMFDTAPSAFAPPTGVPVGPDYPLGPGDSLTVQIWGNQLLTSLIEKSVSGESNSTTESKTSYKVIVSPQGNIFFPRIGVITVLGMTVEVLERELEKRLSEIYAGVKVGVMLTSLRTITVFVIGEVQRPGSYAVNSLSTVFNALYVAGGPNTRGSMRNIKFIRNGKTLDTADLYRYLLEGDKSQDYRLEAGDTIFVPPVGMKTAIAGEVLRPAAYEFKSAPHFLAPHFSGGKEGKVTLKDVVETAGGILPSAYTQRIQVERIQDNKRVLFDIDALKWEGEAPAEPLAVEEKSEIEILDGDTIFVFSVLDIYRNRVTILGNVKRPGIYELKPDMRVSRLVEETEGIFDDTYLNRAEIYRLREDSTTEIIPFNLSDALNHREGSDVKLQNGDKVFIYSYATVERTPYVRVTGQVKSPEAYPLTSNTKVSDLIFRANGIKPKEAYLDRADVFRLNPDGSVIVIPVNLKLVLDGDLKADILLHENDELVVYSKEQLNKIPHVQIQGAVGHPGIYTLALNMKIKDLFFIAGGLTKDAYALRAELIRTKDTGEIQIMPFNPYSLFHENDEKENLELQNYDKIIVYLKGEAERGKYVEVLGEVQAPGAYPLLENMKFKDLIFKSGGVKSTAYTKSIELIRVMPDGSLNHSTVNLEDILNGDESQNLQLQENDQVYVRRIPSWSADRRVELKGEVRFPGTYTISEYETLEQLIKRAGGFKENAYKEGMRLERKSDQVMQYGLIGKNLKKLFEKAEQDWYVIPEISKAAVEAAGFSQAVASGVSSVEPPPSLASQGAQMSSPTLVSRRTESTAPALRESSFEEQSLALTSQGSQEFPIPELLPKKGEYVKINVDVEKMPDYILEDEDIIIVPKRSSYVVVMGEVYNPEAFTYENKKEGRKLDYYIELAGGYTKFANKDDQFIIRANGTAVTKNLDKMKIEPGDLIIIPAKVKEERTSVSTIIRDVTSIVTSALTIGLIIVQITK